MNDRVCAVVVAYNRKDLLRRCLKSLEAQTRTVDEVLVVNNASTDGTPEMVKEEFPQMSLLNLEENGGGAGGFHAGMKEAHERGFDWTWLMDDDARAAPDCLEKLLVHGGGRPNVILVPVQQDTSGHLYGFTVWGVSGWRNGFIDITEKVMAEGKPFDGEILFSFVGPLISRQVVEKAGLPNKDFFIWLDDYDYALRAMSEAHARIVAVPDAVFFHDFYGKQKDVSFLGMRRRRVDQAAWKTYYGVRNHLYITKARGNPHELATYCLIQARGLIGEIVFEPDRWRRAKLRLLGIRDGMMGRMGKRVSVK